jgi:hypothetical protein
METSEDLTTWQRHESERIRYVGRLASAQCLMTIRRISPTTLSFSLGLAWKEMTRELCVLGSSEKDADKFRQSWGSRHPGGDAGRWPDVERMRHSATLRA